MLINHKQIAFQKHQKKATIIGINELAVIKIMIVIFSISSYSLDAFAHTKEINKSVGADWKSGKLTLPLIFLFQSVTEKDFNKLSFLFSDIHKRNYDDCELDIVLGMFNEYKILSSCIDYIENLFLKTSSDIGNFSDITLRNDLKSFLKSFESKLSKIRSLNVEDFNF